jgi:amino acid adenylation domain-containing protein
VSREAVTESPSAALWTLAATEQSIPERFAEQVRRQPDRPAIAGTAWQPSFRELDEASAGIARALGERNGGGGRVALLMNHDAPLIAAMLGVLRAGHTMVVLNPGDPPGRLDLVRRQVEPWLAVVDPGHRDLAGGAGFDRILDLPDPARSGTDDLGTPPCAPDDLAAVMFTSGSTGRPKGVMHTHHTLMHTALRHANGLGLRPDDRVALLASPSGGHGMGTTWMTLLSGATLCPFPVMDRGVAGLPEWLRDHGVTVLGLSASLFRRLAPSLDASDLPAVRLVRLGSEQVVRADLDTMRRHLGGDCRFANVFSLTEAGGLAHCVFSPDEEPAPGPLTVGRPAPGIELLLLDEDGRPVPNGGTGEIVVRSRHLTRGYWRDERLTAERFSDGAATGERTLRTGDLGRLDDQGRLVVVGRRDEQVKIRGYRVELAEVEAAIRALPQVRAAAARAELNRHGDAKLTAYVVARDGVRSSAADLRDGLRATLQEASIPGAFAFVDELPLNAHGKIDREQLAGLSPPAHEAAESPPPRSELERSLGAIWAEALELQRVGLDENFFDLGGDSLTAAEIGAEVHRAFGIELDMRSFTRHPTITQMAKLLGGRRRGARPVESRLERVPRDGPLPCTFGQERIWRFANRPDSSSGYEMAGATGLHGSVDLEALRTALEHVASGHEPLRTTLIERDGRPLQVIHPAGEFELLFSDVSASSDPEARALELLHEEAGRPFDLERGPLVRFRLVRLGERHHRLHRVAHHLVTDRYSWEIFFRELASAYEAILEGRSLAADNGRLQYADFAVWQRRSLQPDGARYRDQVAWWGGTLESAPDSQLHFARPTPASSLDPREGDIRFSIDPDVVRALDRLAREQGGTQYAVRLAVFSALLALEGERDAVTVGAYVDTRRLPETRSMFGYFSNLVTLVLPFDPAAPLRHWVAKVGGILAEATARSDLPYEQLCDELRASGRVPPEIRAIFAVRGQLPDLPFAKTELVSPGPVFVTMPWGFSFLLDQSEETNRCQVAFDAHLHDPVTVREFVDRYRALAEAASSRPDDPLGDLHRVLG